MRTVIFLFLIFPAILQAQINRSATELAKENISGYLHDKIFKGSPYHSVFYGELKPINQKNTEIRWSIVHKFAITETQTEADKKTSVERLYEFKFYLDNKMKVLRAATSY